MPCNSSWEEEVRIYEKQLWRQQDEWRRKRRSRHPLEWTIHHGGCPLNGQADIHPAASGGPHSGVGGCALKEAAAHGEPKQEQVFWQNVWPHGGPTLSCLFLKDYTPQKGPTMEQFWKKCNSMGRTHIGEFHERLYVSCGGDPTLEHQKRRGGGGERNGRDNVLHTDHNDCSSIPCTA